MTNSNIVLSTKKTKKNCKAQITLSPIPNNCHECPFYYMPDQSYEGSWYEHWDCYLRHIDDVTGIAINRPKTCPLNEADKPKIRKGTPLEENDSGYNCEDWIP